MKTAEIYCRYSSDSQTEQSIDGQLRVCNEYAKSNDIVILDTYIDRAMTGTNDNRPDFQRMIKDSAKRAFSYVLVYKFDRFSRNKYETAIHKKTLKDNGVKVIFATEFVPDTPEGIIFESMLEGYAEYYSAELSQKIRRGNNESRRKGNLTGGKMPYGYKNVNKKAVIVPEEADIVRYIFERYSIGVYVKDIIAELNGKGLLHKGKPFVPNTVYGILGNERYSGIYRHNGEVFDNIYPQIVPKETFEKVRAKVNANKFGKRSEYITYLLKDKINCGYCGKSIIGENGTAHNDERKYYYKCRGRKAKLNDCRKQAIRKDILEKIVLESVIEQIQKTNNLDYIVRSLMREQEWQAQANIVLNLLLKEQRQTQNTIQNIMTAIENGMSFYDLSKKHGNRFIRVMKWAKEYRQSHLENKFKRVFRNMKVYYIYGSAECGKTSYVFNKHGYDDVYRTTNYEFAWIDDYNGEKILFLDEFRSSFKISEILDYLDGQPIRIRGRHYNRVACYDTVYIVSNLSLKEQYTNIKQTEPKTWAAFCRRITAVYDFDKSKDIPVNKFTGELKKPPTLIEIADDGDIPF